VRCLGAVGPFFISATFVLDFGEVKLKGYIVQELQSLVEKTVTQLGFDLVDFEMSNRGKLLRVFIDKLNPKDIKDTVNIDDCVLVSNQLGNVLTVEHEVDYDRLEVSSPGMDRVLKKEQDFVRFVGERAQIKLRVPLVLESKEPRKNFIGILRGVKDGAVQIECDGVVKVLLLNNIDKARLSPQF
jgi:ribosome maturation factor RimP